MRKWIVHVITHAIQLVLWHCTQNLPVQNLPVQNLPVQNLPVQNKKYWSDSCLTYSYAFVLVHLVVLVLFWTDGVSLILVQLASSVVLNYYRIR